MILQSRMIVDENIIIFFLDLSSDIRRALQNNRNLNCKNQNILYRFCIIVTKMIIFLLNCDYATTLSSPGSLDASQTQSQCSASHFSEITSLSSAPLFP